MIAFLLLCCGPEPQAPLQIEHPGGDPTLLVVLAPTADLEIRLQGAERPIAARITAGDGGMFHLVPLAPLRHGLTYDIRAGAERVSTTVPPHPAHAPITTTFHPTGAVVPANHLRFYVRFSEPMASPDDLFSAQIQLLDADGEPIDTAFSEVPLWTVDRRQLTLVLHPGRQKQDVGFGRGLGPVLEEGKHYTLRVAHTLADRQGQPLPADALKAFSVGPPDRTRPDPQRWTVTNPEGPDKPLTLWFDEPLDISFLPHAFAVHAGADEVVPIRIELGALERSVLLHPAQRWPPGALVLRRIDAVEDLAANRPERLFEVGLGTAEQALPPFQHRFAIP